MSIQSNLNEPKPQQVPLSAQIAQQENEELSLDGDAALLKGTSRKKRVSDGTLVLVGVVMVAGGVLAGMRMLGGRPGAMLGSDQEEDAVSTRITEIASKTSLGDGSLPGTPDYNPVPLGEVKTNPFVVKVVTSTVVDPGEPDAIPTIGADSTRAVLKAKLDAQFSNLTVRSIMGSEEDGFIAMVDNTVVRVGDKVARTFEVRHIDANSIYLTASGFDYVLDLRPSIKDE